MLRTLARTVKEIAGDCEASGYTQYLPEDLRFDPEITSKAIFSAMLPKSRMADALSLAKDIELDTTKQYGRLSTGNRRRRSFPSGRIGETSCSLMSHSADWMPTPGRHLKISGEGMTHKCSGW